jgi:hypothetical protein
MIIEAEIIVQPFSGQYNERIYDISNPWNSQEWSWIKFLQDDLYEWCGVFRGTPRGVALSEKYDKILVLTSDYLYELDISDGELKEYESNPMYRSLTVTPLGDFILADYYNIYLAQANIKESTVIESPIKMDMIEFDRWEGKKLYIICEEFLNWSNHIKLSLDSETWKINKV